MSDDSSHALKCKADDSGHTAGGSRVVKWTIPVTPFFYCS